MPCTSACDTSCARTRSNPRCEYLLVLGSPAACGTTYRPTRYKPADTPTCVYADPAHFPNDQNRPKSREPTRWLFASLSAGWLIAAAAAPMLRITQVDRRRGNAAKSEPVVRISAWNPV